MKKYLTKNYSDSIRIVEAERETEQCVWVDGHRSSKQSSFETFHDSFDEAKRYLIERHELDIKAARDKIHRAESALGMIRKMTEADVKVSA